MCNSSVATVNDSVTTVKDTSECHYKGHINLLMTMLLDPDQPSTQCGHVHCYKVNPQRDYSTIYLYVGVITSNKALLHSSWSMLQVRSVCKIKNIPTS